MQTSTSIHLFKYWFWKFTAEIQGWTRGNKEREPAKSDGQTNTPAMDQAGPGNPAAVPTETKGAVVPPSDPPAVSNAKTGAHSMDRKI